MKARYPRAQLEDKQPKRQRSVSGPDKSIRDAIPYSAVSPVRQMARELAPATDWLRSLVCDETV